MSPDEPSLSDHEQRILAEIERNLKAEDPEFVRQVSEAKPGNRVVSARRLQLSILGLLIGVGLMAGYFKLLAIGVVGFLVMLASVIGLVTALRDMASSSRSSSSLFRDAFRRAEERMRPKRPGDGSGHPPDA